MRQMPVLYLTGMRQMSVLYLTGMRQMPVLYLTEMRQMSVLYLAGMRNRCRFSVSMRQETLLCLSENYKTGEVLWMIKRKI